jgi:hypothetical protein
LLLTPLTPQKKRSRFHNRERFFVMRGVVAFPRYRPCCCKYCLTSLSVTLPLWLVSI